MLRIRGLAKGIYTLLIDGEVVEALSMEQLSLGTNLAELNDTPQVLQARRVEQLDEQIRLQRVTLRDLAVIRYTVLMPMKIDMTDGTATNAYLAKYVVDQKNNAPGHNAYIAGLIEQYQQNLANEPALREAIATEAQAAEKASLPLTHHYELRKTN